TGEDLVQIDRRQLAGRAIHPERLPILSKHHERNGRVLEDGRIERRALQRESHISHTSESSQRQRPHPSAGSTFPHQKLPHARSDEDLRRAPASVAVTTSRTRSNSRALSKK